MTCRVEVRDEIRFVEALCNVYTRSRVTLERFFLPGGDPNQHRLDAIVWVTDGDHRRHVAVEVTKCFQGIRVNGSPPSQNEVEAWQRLKDKITGTLAAEPCLETRCVEPYLIFAEEIEQIQEAFAAPRTRDDRRADTLIDWIAGMLASPLREALHRSLKSRRAEKATIPTELQGIVVHAQVDAYTDRPQFDDGWIPPTPGVDVLIRGLVSVGQSGQKVTTILPRWVGIDPTGVIEAAKPKVEVVARYKAFADEYGADELWLIIVADGSSQMSLVAAPMLTGVKEGIRELHRHATAKGWPFFDRVIFLAAGYWAPDDLRDMDAMAVVGMRFMAFDLHG